MHALPLFSLRRALSKAWLAAFVASASYLARLGSRLYAAKLYYSTLTASMLSERLTRNGDAAVTFLVRDAHEQQAKQVVELYRSLPAR